MLDEIDLAGIGRQPQRQCNPLHGREKVGEHLEVRIITGNVLEQRRRPSHLAHQYIDDTADFILAVSSFDIEDFAMLLHGLDPGSQILSTRCHADRIHANPPKLAPSEGRHRLANPAEFSDNLSIVPRNRPQPTCANSRSLPEAFSNQGAQTAMPALNLKFASGPYDRMDALLTGTVAPEAITLETTAIQSPREMFDRAVVGMEFDITEMSTSEHIAMHCAGNNPFVAIPVFPSKVFRHGFITVNRANGIARARRPRRQTHRRPTLYPDRGDLVPGHPRRRLRRRPIGRHLG